MNQMESRILKAAAGVIITVAVAFYLYVSIGRFDPIGMSKPEIEVQKQLSTLGKKLNEYRDKHGYYPHSLGDEDFLKFSDLSRLELVVRYSATGEEGEILYFGHSNLRIKGNRVLLVAPLPLRNGNFAYSRRRYGTGVIEPKELLMAMNPEKLKGDPDAPDDLDKAMKLLESGPRNKEEEILNE